MTTAAGVLALCIAPLIGATDAGSRVFSPLDIPTAEGEYPMLFVLLDDEDGESWGNVGGPQFTVTGRLQITGRVEAVASNDDAGAALVYAALGQLRDQCKAAIFNAGLLAPIGPVQEFAGFRSSMSRSDATSGKHGGQVVLSIDLKYLQDLSDFPTTPVPLENVHITTNAPAGTPAAEVDTYNLNA